MVGLNTILEKEDMNNKTIRRIAGTILSIIAVFSFALAGLIAPTLLTDKWDVTVTHSSTMSPAILNGSLIVSKPVDANTVTSGTLAVFGINTSAPKVGRVIETNTREDVLFVTAYGTEDDPSDVFTSSTLKNINEVVFTIPVVGSILTPILSIPGALIATLLVFALILIYRYGFFIKPPYVEEELEEDDSIESLQQIWDNTQPKMTRAQKREHKQNIKNATKETV